MFRDYARPCDALSYMCVVAESSVLRKREQENLLHSISIVCGPVRVPHSSKVSYIVLVDKIAMKEICDFVVQTVTGQPQNLEDMGSKLSSKTNFSLDFVYPQKKLCKYHVNIFVFQH